MPRFDSGSAEILVFTYKEGLLSAVAHDLMIKVERFTLEVEGAPSAAAPAITLDVDPASLRVVSAMRDGRPDPSALSASDRAKIESNIQADVLDTRRHPRIRFTSSATREGAGWRVSGRLELHGRTRDLSLTSRRDGDRQVAEVRLHQPDFGIKPYSAMLGTLRIRPDLLVRVSVPDLPG